MTELYEVTHEATNSLVHTWKYIELGVWNNHRLYYRPIESISKDDEKLLNGFYFYVLDFAQGPALHDGKTDIWSHATLVEIFLTGTAYWDGLRHIYFTPNEDGYINYPNAILMIEVCDNLRQLEEIYCRENDGNKY